MANHEVKAEKAEIDAIEKGEQTALVRLNSNFALDDIITLREFDPRTLKVEGRVLMLRITHMKNGSEIQDGAVLSPLYAIMSFQRIGDAEQSNQGNFP